MSLIFVFLLILSSINVSTGSPLQIINSDGLHNTEFAIGKFIMSRAASKSHPLKLLSVLDCTGANDCSLVNKFLGTSFRSTNGMSASVK